MFSVSACGNGRFKSDFNAFKYYIYMVFCMAVLAPRTILEFLLITKTSHEYRNYIVLFHAQIESVKLINFMLYVFTLYFYK